MSKIVIDDTFGAQQLLKDIMPNAHMIDIRVRMDGNYYWFEGDYLKRIFQHIEFNRTDPTISATLEGRRQI